MPVTMHLLSAFRGKSMVTARKGHISNILVDYIPERFEDSDNSIAPHENIHVQQGPTFFGVKNQVFFPFVHRTGMGFHQLCQSSKNL